MRLKLILLALLFVSMLAVDADARRCRRGGCHYSNHGSYGFQQRTRGGRRGRFRQRSRFEAQQEPHCDGHVVKVYSAPAPPADEAATVEEPATEQPATVIPE